jgi:starch synthase
LHLQRRKGASPGTATVLTIHNLPFMGPTMAPSLAEFGLRRVRTGLPDWASSRPLPLGIWAADAIVAVSPTYSREIQTPQSGSGLHQYLRARSDSLYGILNGIDVESFNPATDPALDVNYGLPTLERRVANKSALQRRFGLLQDSRTFTLGVVSRLDSQKGTDLIPAALRRLPELDWQLIVLGTGQPRLEQSLQRLRRDFPDRVRVEITFDANLARQIYAGADALLMPSRYEPCGLAQMIAMRYGCIPVVSAVGGLVDTVVDGTTGIVMGPATVTRLASAIKKAVRMHADGELWLAMQRATMAQDFSWRASAEKYWELYSRVASNAQLPQPG